MPGEFIEPCIVDLKIGTETPDQIRSKWFESFSIRDPDLLFHRLPDRPAPTPHQAGGRESALLSGPRSLVIFVSTGSGWSKSTLIRYLLKAENKVIGKTSERLP